MSSPVQSNQISVQELAKKLEEKTIIFLLDVRNLEEHNHYNLGGTLIPLSELPMRLNEIPTHTPVVVYCHSGYRSQIAMEYLITAGFKEVSNLAGGVLAWMQHLS